MLLNFCIEVETSVSSIALPSKPFDLCLNDLGDSTNFLHSANLCLRRFSEAKPTDGNNFFPAYRPNLTWEKPQVQYNSKMIFLNPNHA